MADQEKAVKLSLIDTLFKYGKMVFVVGGAIGSAAIAYNMIYANADAIKSQKKAFNNELDLRDQRSDKRYKRAKDLGYEVKEIIKHHDAKIEKLQEKAAYERGKLDMYIKMNGN